MAVIDLNPALVVLELEFLLLIIKEMLKRKEASVLRVFSVNLLALDMAVNFLELKNTDICNCFRSSKNVDICN